MIVDCHTHMGFTPETGVTPQHLLAEGAVDACIVLGDFDGPDKDVNKRLSDYIKNMSGKMIGFAAVDPVNDVISVKKVSVLKDRLGLQGAAVYCCRCGFRPTHSRAMRFYEAAEELGLPVFFHNAGNLNSDSVLEYAQPYMLDEVSRTFPKLKIIVGSMGFPFVNQTLALLSKTDNVYADLTINPDSVWQVYNTVISAFECGVMDKLLFGSGFPDSIASRCIETLLGFNRLLGDTGLPLVPRINMRNIIERDTLQLLGITKPVKKS